MSSPQHHHSTDDVSDDLVDTTWKLQMQDAYIIDGDNDEVMDDITEYGFSSAYTTNNDHMLDEEDQVFDPCMTSNSESMFIDGQLEVTEDDYKVKPVDSLNGAPVMYETGYQTYMVLSVVVTVCFNLPMGAIAFLVSVKSSDSFKAGDVSAGHARARCSLVISMMGIVMTVTVIMGVVFYIANQHRQMMYGYG